MLPNSQPALPLGHARGTSSRRSFAPSPCCGAYKLPHEAQDRLTAALRGFRNREAAHALAVFLARFWSAPRRLGTAFPIDRRALAVCASLDLTEAQVRGAIRTLVAVGYITPTLVKGSPLKRTPDGLRRKPILHRFSREYGLILEAANQRAQRARMRRAAAADASTRVGADVARLPAQSAPPRAVAPRSPITNASGSEVVIMGEKAGRLPQAVNPTSSLDRALERLSRAIGEEGRI